MVWRRLSTFVIPILILTACGGNPTSITPPPAPPTQAQIMPSPTVIPPTPPAAGELATADDVLAYLVGRQQDVALVSYTVNQDGSIADDAPIIMHHPNESMALGPTIQLLILAGYAWEVEQGILDPNQSVDLADVEAWYLPYLDGGIHKETLNRLVISSDERGYSRQSATLRLEQIIEMMLKHHDFAAGDFMLSLLQPDTIQTIIDQAGLEGVAPPVSFLGSVLLFAVIGQYPDQNAYLDGLEDQSHAERAALMQALVDDYQADPSKYHGWISISVDDWPEHALQQRYFQTLTPHGTAKAYAQLMAYVATGNFISSSVSERMRVHLEWPMTTLYYQSFLNYFGGMGGGLPSILTQAFYMHSKAAPWEDRPRVVVLLQRNLSEADVDALWETGALNLIEIELGSNPEFIQNAATVLKQP